MKIYSPKAGKRSPLGQTAFDKIHKKIITLDYKPGQSLEEKLLMHKLGLGRTPIREALLRLSAQRLVESQPGKGFIVRPITLQSTRAVFESMKVLETGAAAVAVRQDFSEHLPGMKKSNENVRAAIRSLDLLRLVDANHEFHMGFARCSANPYFIRWIEEVRTEAKRLSYLSYANEIEPDRSLPIHYESVINDHDKIISLLERREEAALAKTIMDHILAFQKRILLFMGS